MAVASPPTGRTSEPSQGGKPSTESASQGAKGGDQGGSEESGAGKVTGFIRGLFGKRDVDAEPGETTARKASSDKPGASRDQQPGDLTREQVRARTDADLKNLRVSGQSEQVRRWAQSEIDRRVAQAHQDATRKQAEDRERWLRDNDPEAYADLQRNKEAAKNEGERTSAEVSSFVTNVVKTYDRAILDPVFEALDDKTRGSLLKAHTGKGLEQRTKLVKAALEELRKTWVQEGAEKAAAKLRRDPAFRQRLALEVRESLETPEHVDSKKSAAPTTDGSTFIRSLAGRYKGPDD